MGRGQSSVASGKSLLFGTRAAGKIEDEPERDIYYDMIEVSFEADWTTDKSITLSDKFLNHLDTTSNKHAALLRNVKQQGHNKITGIVRYEIHDEDGYSYDIETSEVSGAEMVPFTIKSLPAPHPEITLDVACFFFDRSSR